LSQISAAVSSTSRIAPRNKSGKESEGGVLYCPQGSCFISFFVVFSGPIRYPENPTVVDHLNLRLNCAS
jgi:hypothetical protein